MNSQQKHANDDKFAIAKNEAILGRSAAALSAGFQREHEARNYLLVFEPSDRLRALYSQLQGRFFSGIWFYSELEEMCEETQIAHSTDLIILDIGISTQSNTRFVEPLCEAFPNATILITAPKGVAKYMDDIKAISDRVEILAKPFSFSGLMANVQQFRKNR